MAKRSWKRWVIALVVGAMPLTTVATCNETENGQRFMFNSNDDLLIGRIVHEILD